MKPRADDWEYHWEQQGIVATLNPAQKNRHSLVIRRIRKELPTSLIDIGCGQGDLLCAVSNEIPSAKLYGIELSAVGTALTNTKVPSALVFTKDLNDETYEPVVSDLRCLTCVEVLEHVDDPLSFLKTALLHLGQNGLALITVPSGPITAFDKSIGHRRHFSRSEIESLMRDAGLRDIRVRRVGFPFFNLYRLAVLLRGKRLIQDVATDSISTSKSARLVMILFAMLFHFNVNRIPFGWQVIAEGTKD